MAADVIALPRARGAARIRVEHRDGRSRLADLYQSGTLRLRLPRTADPELVGTLINTAGGLTGGDALAVDVEVGADAGLTVATQSAEKLYRAGQGHARVDVRLRVGAKGRLAWLPRETILFDGSALRRTLHADLEPGARLLAVEAWVAGREAMGERLARCDVRDDWRVRVDGGLAHAEAFRLPGEASERRLASPAGWNNMRALATVLLVAPDASALIAGAREIVGGLGAVDAWEGPHARLVARLAAPDHLALQRRLVPLLAVLRRHLGMGMGDDPRAALPLVWSV